MTTAHIETADLATMAKQLLDRPDVYTAKVWQDRRIYVGLTGYDKSWAGDRNLKMYYDPKLGWVYEGFKGLMSHGFRASFASFCADFLPKAR